MVRVSPSFNGLGQRIRCPPLITRQHKIGQNKRCFHADTAGTEIPLNSFEKGAVGCIMQINRKRVRKHEFNTAQGVIGPWILAKPEGEAIGMVGMPVNGGGIDLRCVQPPVFKHTDTPLSQVGNIFLKLGQDIFNGDGWWAHSSRG